MPPRAPICPSGATGIAPVLLHILRRDGLLKFDLVLELGEIVAAFWGRKDGGILREVAVVRLLSVTVALLVSQRRSLCVKEIGRTLYKLSSMKSRTSIFTFVGGSLRERSSVAVTRR